MLDDEKLQKGYALFYRTLFDHPFWKIKPFDKGHAWVDLVLLANHEDGGFDKRGIWIPVKRGQVGKSQEGLADRWGWSRKKVSTFLSWLEKNGQIALENAHEISKLTTIITIVNYESYQNPPKKKNMKSTSEEHEKHMKGTHTNNENELNALNELKEQPPNPPSSKPESKTNGRTAQARELVAIYLGAKKVRPRGADPSDEYWPDEHKVGVRAVIERAVKNAEKLLRKYPFDDLKLWTQRAAEDQSRSRRPYMVTNVFGEKGYVLYYTGTQESLEELLGGIETTD